MSTSKIGRWIGFVLCVSIVLMGILYKVKDSYIKSETQVIESYEAWNPELVEAFGSLPIQDGGRIKPISTWAGFEMLALNSKRSLKFQVGAEGEKHKIKQVEWVLDLMFKPDLAAQLDMFKVDDAAVLDMFGMDNQTESRQVRCKIIKGITIRPPLSLATLGLIIHAEHV